MAAQFLISAEVLAAVVVFACLALVFTAVCRIDTFRECARSMARSLGIAALTAGAIIAYPVWMMLAGPQHFVGSTIPGVNPYHNDLWSTVTPGPLQQVSLGMQSLGRRVEVGGTPNLISGPNPTETGGYLGVAVLIAIVVFAWRGRRSLRMQLAVLLLLASELLALGPSFAVGGHLTGFALPFLFFNHVPLLDNLLPSRLNFEAGACAAAVIAFGLDDMRNRPIRDLRHSVRLSKHVRARRGAAAAIVVLLALVATQLPRWPYKSQAASVLPPAVRQAVPADNPIAITFPYVTGVFTVSPLIWQADDGFAFRLLGGYGYHPGREERATTAPARMSPPQLQQFLTAESGFPLYGLPPPMSQQLLVSVREALDRYHVKLVIVDHSVPGGDKVTSLFTRVLGPPRVSSGQFRLWVDWNR